MKLYIGGVLSCTQETFLPTALYFANTEAECNDEPSENCLKLEGVLSEVVIDGTVFSCRFKGVTMETDRYYGENFTKEDVMNLIKSKDMVLANMEAYYDGDVDVTVTSIVMDGMELDKSLLGEAIEFIEFTPGGKETIEPVKNKGGEKEPER